MVEKPFKSPDATMHRLIEAREKEVASREAESGTVQEDSDLKQTIDKFRQRLNDIEKIRSDKKKEKLALEVEKEDAARDRDDMLRRLGTKRSREIIDLDGEEEDVQPSTSSTTQPRRVQPRSGTLKAPGTNASIVSSAILQVGKQVKDLMRARGDTTEAANLETRLEKVEISLLKYEQMEARLAFLEKLMMQLLSTK
jgi:hypothetical protein